MNLEAVKKEMEWSLAGGGGKDILVVVRNQYEYVQNCLESVFRNTKNFNLRIWDNASSGRTKNFLSELGSEPNVKIYRSETNEGFVRPNNKMAEESQAEWMILLNSDTEVLPRWDEVMIGVLKNNPEIKQVGFGGGMLGRNCEFSGLGAGYQIDYVCGYCFCINKNTAAETGLFDEQNIEFAYCEDSDLSLRIRERGWRIYACHSEDMVRHYGSMTSREVAKEDDRLKICARKNLEYMKKRWSAFLELYSGGKICYHP